MQTYDDKSTSDMLREIYVNVGAPLTFFTIFVGFWSGVIGEANYISSQYQKSLQHQDSSQHQNSSITTFVNITGSTFIGFCSGLFWPVTMPILSAGAIYNKFAYR